MQSITDHELVAALGLPVGQLSVQPVGHGLIHKTWKLTIPQKNVAYILQEINTEVFTTPEAIGNNHLLVKTYLQQQAPDYRMIAPVQLTDGNFTFCNSNGKTYRLLEYVPHTRTFQQPETAALACSAARAFGQFTALSKGLDVSRLTITLPDFHNLSLRYQQFLHALQHGNAYRLQTSVEVGKQLQAYASLTETYEAIIKSPYWKKRLTHHDTKISNVLFDKDGQVVCLVDLDTVMPGYYISDVGDMMRNYLSAASEEATDLSAIAIRWPWFEGLAQGYLSQMAPLLSRQEADHFVYAGLFMTYMQALRFYTDYLQNDCYYPVNHPRHNLIRAQNQLVLLEKMLAGQQQMQALATEYYHKYHVHA